jgi:phage gpG-like protein
MISYSIDNDRRFRNGLERAKSATSDLRVPFTLIANDFYRSQRAIFNLKSPGQYPDLAASTKKQRDHDGQPYYPILVGVSGDLFRAASMRGADGNVTLIGKQTLAMGVDARVIPYAIYHQSDKPRKKIPQRKFLFIGPEAKQFANSDQMGRLERWLNTLNSYVLKVMKQQGFDTGEV